MMNTIVLTICIKKIFTCVDKMENSCYGFCYFDADISTCGVRTIFVY